MTIRYYDDEIEGESCPNCQSDETRFDRGFGFWKCENCSELWCTSPTPGGLHQQTLITKIMQNATIRGET